MGSPKALLLSSDGRPFVVCVAAALAAGGVDEVVIVTGNHHDAIVAAPGLDSLPLRPRIVRNPDPSRGQLSSLLVGLGAVDGQKPDGLLITLVDVPMISPATVRTVIDVWQRTRAPIVRPSRGDRHGHPVIFDRSIFAELRDAPLDAGAKTVVRAHAAELINVPVEDEGCLTDVDTPQQYEALRRASRS
jgi:molybdenum cofactor cytidylyltransferase